MNGIAPDGDTRDTNVPVDAAVSITLDDLEVMRVSIGNLEDSIAALSKAADKAVAEASFEAAAAKAIEQVIGLVMKHVAGGGPGVERPDSFRRILLEQLAGGDGLAGVINKLRAMS